MGRTNEGCLEFRILPTGRVTVSEFLFDTHSDDDSGSDRGVVNDTTDLDYGDLSSFEYDLDDDLEDISLFD
jgi:hypothetical protein